MSAGRSSPDQSLAFARRMDFDTKIDHNQSSDGGAGWGSGGGWLEGEEEVLVKHSRNESLSGQRLPQPLSLVRFLCGHKK